MARSIPDSTRPPAPILTPQSHPLRPSIPPPINRNLALLHPSFRNSIIEVLSGLNRQGIPLKLFEGYRTPERQTYLYQQGRTSQGRIITRARSWESFHNFGLAADFAIWTGKDWSWKDTGVESTYWDELHALGEFYGLRKLDFEKPHLELAAIELSDLRAAKFPGAGDASWWSNLEMAMQKWKGEPPAPRLA